MKFTRIVYGLAVAYGFVSLLPLYFLIEKLGKRVFKHLQDQMPS